MSVIDSYLKNVQKIEARFKLVDSLLDELTGSLNVNNIPPEKRLDYFIQLATYQKAMLELTTSLLTAPGVLSELHVALLAMFNSLDIPTREKLLKFIEDKVLKKDEAKNE